MMDKGFPEALKKCFDIFDQNIQVLTNLEIALEEEKEDELTPNLELHQLYDMTEDIAQSAKLKHAESHLMRRQTEVSF